ncbi:MAG: AAA family ATPase, partial [Pseudomonadota bacterium]
MLAELSIRSLVLVERLDIEVSTGLTAVTGETGAGKSVLLDAVGLLIGAVADRGLIKAGADRASVRGSFSLNGDHPVWGVLSGHGVDFDRNEMLILERQLPVV